MEGPCCIAMRVEAAQAVDGRWALLASFIPSSSSFLCCARRPLFRVPPPPPPLAGCHGAGKTALVRAFEAAGVDTIDESFMQQPPSLLHAQSLLNETAWTCGCVAAGASAGRRSLSGRLDSGRQHLRLLGPCATLQVVPARQRLGAGPAPAAGRRGRPAAAHGACSQKRVGGRHI
jgi:hypothetical protein